MSKSLVRPKFVLSLFLCLAVMFACTSPVWAQTGSTGALTGTVTDPSGAVIVGAKVTATNIGTGQPRAAETGSDGSYKFSLLQPGNYSVEFSAKGFKTAEVPSVTVNVTETAVLNHSLEVGAQAERVTVEATAETLQTQNVTNGGLVSGAEVTALPLVSRNYTQIISLSPGVVTNVTSASAVGNGTQDVSANGSKANQNNYSMDGASVVNYLSGTGAQTGSFPGMAIANPDAIQEFKVQTSQYDASSGRNSGANVDVITKTGQNQFHGNVFEFNRNNFFNANDYFYKFAELHTLQTANKPQTLKQNTFGGTIGGPIKKDKLFFFGSYQGFRQINGVGTSGFAAGYTPNTLLMPWDDPNDPGDPRHLSGPAYGPGSYREYLGSVFGGVAQNPPFLPGNPSATCTLPLWYTVTGNIFGPPSPLRECNTGFFSAPPNGSGTNVTIAPDGSNISNTAIGYLQAAGVVKGGFNHGFYFPSAPANCSWVPTGNPNVPIATPDRGCIAAISAPTHANEDQYLINTQYILSSKHTLEERYMYQSDPQEQTFSCFISAGNCNPGAPVNAHYFNHIGQLKLTSVLRPNFVNEARFSFHRDVENNTDPTTAKACNTSSTANVIPLVNNGEPCPLTTTPPNSLIAAKFPEANLLPMVDILGVLSPSGAWSQGGNFAMISSNFNNTFQYADQISWTHGMHTVRAGFEWEHLQHNGTIPASTRGELLIWSTADFLTSSAGSFAQDPTYDDGTPQTAGGGILVGFGLKGWLTHYNHVSSFTSYVQDDIKVSPKLTVNAGVRWEYNGLPNDVSGRFANVWSSDLARVNTGSYFLDPANAAGTLVGFVLPSNYDKSAGLTAPNGASGVRVNSNSTLVPAPNWHNFAPRLGLAWQPLGNRFVVRAGYGLFYDRLYGVLLIDNQLNLPPYSGAASGPSPQNQGNTLHDPWAAGGGVPLQWTPRFINCVGPCATDGPFVSSGLGYTSDSPRLADRLPLTQQYSLDFQYEFARGWIGDIGYVGSHGTHLYNWSQQVNVAHVFAGDFHNTSPGDPTQTQNVAMVKPLPFNDSANATPVTRSTIANLNERVSYLGFAPGGMAETNTNGDSRYNSLQAQIRHMFGHGLFLQVSYTWSKEFTNINDTQAGAGIEPPGAQLYGASNINNPLDFRQQYGLAAFNRSQRAVITYSYDLPWKHTEGFSGKALGGWSISGVTTVQNGEPFTITDTGGGTIYGAGTSRAALASPGACDAQGNCQSTIPIATSGGKAARVDPNNPAASWININAFQPLATATADSPYCIGGVFSATGSSAQTCGANPASCFCAGGTYVGAGTGYGNSKIGVITGPGQFNFDMAVAKNTKIWEHGSIQFRAEFFNVWNHAQFNPPPGNNVNSAANFGKIRSTSVTPRVVQFALKYTF